VNAEYISKTPTGQEIRKRPVAERNGLLLGRIQILEDVHDGTVPYCLSIKKEGEKTHPDMFGMGRAVIGAVNEE